MEELEFPQDVQMLLDELITISSNSSAAQPLVNFINYLRYAPIQVSQRVGEPIYVSLDNLEEQPGYSLSYQLRMTGADSGASTSLNFAFTNEDGQLNPGTFLYNLDLFFEFALNDPQDIRDDRSYQFYRTAGFSALTCSKCDYNAVTFPEVVRHEFEEHDFINPRIKPERVKQILG